MAQYLTVVNGKLRIDWGDAKLILSESEDEPCCCDGCTYFWFAICNSNQARDDNFNVSINGNDLGVLDLNANAQVGWIIHTGPQPTQEQIGWIAGCYDNAVFKSISKSDLRVGGNSVNTTLAQANKNGNAGSWGCGLWSKKEDETCAGLGGGGYGDAPGNFPWTLTQEQYDALDDA